MSQSSMNNYFVLPAPSVPSLPVVGTDKRFAVRRIYCVGRNYADHIKEMGADEREPPFFFQKPSDALRGPDAQIPYPSKTKDFQHEVELVLVIGKAGRNIAPSDASQHVWGLGVGLDMTRRDLQVAAKKMGRPWEIGKSFDASAPCSAITPLNGAALPTKGKIEMQVNGSVRQTGDLSQLIWSCNEIIAELSKDYELEVGDLIMTGTPAGVAAVVVGDQLLARVEAIGELRVKIV